AQHRPSAQTSERGRCTGSANPRTCWSPSATDTNVCHLDPVPGSILKRPRPWGSTNGVEVSRLRQAPNVCERDAFAYQRRGDHFCPKVNRAKVVGHSCVDHATVGMFRFSEQVFLLAKVECAHHDRSTGAGGGFIPNGF